MDLDVLGYNDSPTKKSKRSVIINSAFLLFNKKLILRTTINEISDSAGITRQTFYNYYKNKNEITEDIQILALEELNWFELMFKRDLTINEHLKKIVEIILVEKLDYFRYLNNFDLKFNSSYYSIKYSNYIDNKLSMYRKYLSETGEYERILQIFLGYCQRVVIRVPFNTVCEKEYLDELYTFIDVIC